MLELVSLRTFPTEERIFLDESLFREFSISEIGQVVGPETGCVLAETGSNVAWLDFNLIRAGRLVDLKAGATFRSQAATKQPDGTYTATAISVGSDGAQPF